MYQGTTAAWWLARKTMQPSDSEQIPEAIRHFVVEHIDSVAEMEALLLLHGHPERAGTVEGIARQLYVRSTEAAALLHLLCQRGLAAEEAGPEARYRYSPRTPQLASLVDGLVECYRRALIPVTKLIHSKRRTAAQQFADAFRMGKDSTT